MSPLLSVIVPAYNVAQYLPDCLDSILANTLRDIEVIVVDDGSPDECAEIAEDYAARDPRVKVLRQENQGLGPARNNGAAIATGKYLMFIDSDDLVTPRAFELMVASLEETGSDIAAANAWRYFPSRGNVPSWTHRQAMAVDRPATHIREFPLLVRDRMAWNKVWRHSFWSEHGFAFPPIRYEDYPVGLRAHLLASSVDVLSARVYLWRQREASTSITQLSANVDNVADRVTSAEMVLAVAEEEGAGPEITKSLHAYFIDIDLITVAEALATAAPEDVAAMEQLMLRLARRLKPQRKGTTRLAKLIHRAARAGKLDAVRAMARWRIGSDRRALMRAMLTPQTVTMLPALVAAVRPRRSRVLALRERRLRSQLLTTEVIGDDLLLTAEVKLRGSLLNRARVAAELVVGDEVHDLAVTVGDRAKFSAEVTIRVPLTAAAHWLAEEDGYLRARITLGPLRWRGPLPCDVSVLPPPIRLADGTWFVTSHRSTATSHLWLRRLPEATVGDVVLGSDRLEVHLDDQPHGFVALVRTAPSDPLVRPVLNHVATFEWADVAAGDPADNPANGMSYRPLVYLPTFVTGEVAKAVEAFEDEDESVAPMSAAEQQLADDQAGVDARMVAVPDAAQGEADRDGMSDELARDDAGSELVWPIFARASAAPVDHADHRYTLERTRLGAAEIVMQHRDHLRD